eukprot:EG_transcript_8746
MPASSAGRRLLLAVACGLAAATTAATSNHSWHPLHGSAQDPLTLSVPTCGWDTELLGACTPESDELRRLAHSMRPVTDKVDVHFYHLMYGLFLAPLRHTVPFKFFEIGLGCNMQYGPGASARLWRQYLPEADLWEADVDEACILNHMERLQQLGIKALHGNQADPNDLQQWIKNSGSRFNAIVDDGGHSNTMILTTFAALWEELEPGGLYFLEDLLAGRCKWFDDAKGMVMSDVVQAWLEELVVGFPSCDPAMRKAPDSLRRYGLWRLPRRVQWLFCQAEACVLRKAAANTSVTSAPVDLPQLDMFASLLRPLRQAEFRPRILLHGVRCADRPAVVRPWLSVAPTVALWLLDPEGGCEDSAFRLNGGNTSGLEGLPESSGSYTTTSTTTTTTTTTHSSGNNLHAWAARLTFHFDVVVDYSNARDVSILETFLMLWPCLKGSGLYLIPRLRGRSPAHGRITVLAVLQSWLDSLLIGTQKFQPKYRPHLPSGANPWRLPVKLLFAGCEQGACVLGRWPYHTHHTVNYKLFARGLLPHTVNQRYDSKRRCH